MAWPGALADDVELALEGVAGRCMPRPRADEHLADHRLDLLARGSAERRVVHRHVAPAEQQLAFVRDRALDLVLAGRARGGLARQEHHADAVLARPPAASRPASPSPRARRRPGIWIRMPAPSPCSGSAPVAPRCVRLSQDREALLDDVVATCGPWSGGSFTPCFAIASRRNLSGIWISRPAPSESFGPAHRAAVAEVLQHRQALLDDRVRLLALDVRDEADAARVVFVRRVIETLRRR